MSLNVEQDAELLRQARDSFDLLLETITRLKLILSGTNASIDAVLLRRFTRKHIKVSLDQDLWRPL